MHSMAQLDGLPQNNEDLQRRFEGSWLHISDKESGLNDVVCVVAFDLPYITYASYSGKSGKQVNKRSAADNVVVTNETPTIGLFNHDDQMYIGRRIIQRQWQRGITNRLFIVRNVLTEQVVNDYYYKLVKDWMYPSYPTFEEVMGRFAAGEEVDAIAMNRHWGLLKGKDSHSLVFNETFVGTVYKDRTISVHPESQTLSEEAIREFNLRTI